MSAISPCTGEARTWTLIYPASRVTMIHREPDATLEKEREIAVGATPAPRKQSRVDTRVQMRSVYNVISRTLAR